MRGIVGGKATQGFAASPGQMGCFEFAYNLGKILRMLVQSEPIKCWSLISLKEMLIKIGANLVSHDRCCRSSQ